MLNFALQQLAFDVRRKGLERYRADHPRVFTHFVDLKEGVQGAVLEKGAGLCQEQGRRPNGGL